MNKLNGVTDSYVCLSLEKEKIIDQIESEKSFKIN